MTGSEEIRALAERMAAAVASQITTSESVGRVIRSIPPPEKSTQPPKKQTPDSPRAIDSESGTRETGKFDIH